MCSQVYTSRELGSRADRGGRKEGLAMWGLRAGGPAIGGTVHQGSVDQQGPKALPLHVGRQ
jgi:hypothetical protein